MDDVQRKQEVKIVNSRISLYYLFFNPPSANISAPRHYAVELAYFVLLLGANTLSKIIQSGSLS